MSSINNIPLILLGAVLIGLGCSSFFCLAFSFGPIPPQARWFDIWIPLVVLFFMMILIRARKEERSFHFWEGLILGNFMLWLGGFLSGIFIWILTEISPGFFETFIASSIRYLVEFDHYAPKGQKIVGLKDEIAKINAVTPTGFILNEATQKLYYSFLLVPFVSLILRRK